MAQLPPTWDRFYNNVQHIMKIVDNVNRAANKYYTEHASGYRARDPNWAIPTVSDFLLNSGVVYVNEQYKTKENRIEMMNKFIFKSYSHWNQLINRDSKYFVEIAEILFDGITYGTKEIVSLFTHKKLDNSSFLDKETENLVWDRVHAMLKISIKHIEAEKAKFAEKLKEGKIQTLDLETGEIIQGENSEPQDPYKDIDLSLYQNFMTAKK